MHNFTSLFVSILNVSFMAVVVFILIILTKLLLKNQLSPRWNYLLWTLLIVRLALPWSPESSYSLFNLFSSDIVIQTQDNRNQASDLLTVQTPTDPIFIDNGTTQSVQNIDQTIKQLPDSQSNLWNALALLWGVGILLTGIYMFWVNRQFAISLQKEARKCRNSFLPSILESCRESLKIKANVVLFESDLVTTPTLYGLFKPKLLIPRTLLETLDEQEWKYVFLHEVSHIKRKDILINGIMNVLLLIHWFNPCVWIAFNLMRKDQEMACDSLALTKVSQEERRKYGLTLIKLLEHWSSPIPLSKAVYLSGNKNDLKRRMNMIGSKKNSYRLSIVGLLILVIIAALTLTGAKSSNASNNMELPEKQLVERTVHNYYRSIYERDSNLYLSSVANADSPAQQYFASQLDGIKIDYEIVKAEKINSTKYQVYVANLTHDNKLLPVIPYDVVLEDGQWRLDRSTISIIPKEEIQKMVDAGKVIPKDSPFYDKVVSENEHFIIKKAPNGAL